MTRKTKHPNYKAFARKVLDEFGCDWDGGSLQELAVKCGILVEVSYDPDIDGPNDYGVEPGDPWYVFADEEEQSK